MLSSHARIFKRISVSSLYVRIVFKSEIFRDLGGGDYEIKPTTVTYSEHPKKISMDDLYKEIDFMEKWTNELFEDTVVFCHNDLAVIIFTFFFENILFQN